MKRKILSVATSVAMFISLVMPVQADDLLGYYDDGALLGVASQFSVFVENDFGAEGSDCEGRLYAGGSANLGSTRWYATAESPYASVIVGDGLLTNFDIGNRTFVIGSNGETTLERNVIVADLIDREGTFEALRYISSMLGNTPPTGILETGTWDREIVFRGTKSDYNFFELDSDAVAA